MDIHYVITMPGLIQKVRSNYLTLKSFFSLKISNYPKKIYIDPEKLLDLNIYGNLRDAKKIVLLSHTIADNSDGLINIFLSEKFYENDFCVVAINSLGFRNLITEKPFTGEVSRVKDHYLLIDNALSYIKEYNNTAPIILSAFSAGGYPLISFAMNEKRDIAGVVVIAPVYDPESTNRMKTVIHSLSALTLTKVYTKNFILTSSFDKMKKIYKNPFTFDSVYIHNDEKLDKLLKNNLTNVDIICLHCEDDPVVLIDDARQFVKNANSEKIKLIEFINQGHSLSDDIIAECMKQSNILCQKNLDMKKEENNV